MSRSLTREPKLPAEPAIPGPLYERDFYGWIKEQVALLREGRLSELDTENLAEELDDVGRNQFARLRSALRVLVMHMLKWDEQPEHRTPSWIFSIREQRRRYREILADNPSLKPRRDEALAEAYESARDWAANETHLAIEDFPESCPYDWDDILERPFEMDPER